MVEVLRPQTKRTMIAVFRSYGSIGNDGTTSQTSERCLTGTKSFLEELLYIHVYYNKYSFFLTLPTIVTTKAHHTFLLLQQTNYIT